MNDSLHEEQSVYKKTIFDLNNLVSSLKEQILEKDRILAQHRLGLSSLKHENNNLVNGNVVLTQLKKEKTEWVYTNEKNDKLIENLTETMREQDEMLVRVNQQLEESHEANHRLAKELERWQFHKAIENTSLTSDLVRSNSVPEHVEKTKFALYSTRRDVDEILAALTSSKASLDKRITEIESIQQPELTVELKSENTRLSHLVEQMKVDQNNALSLISKLESQINGYANELLWRDRENNELSQSIKLLKSENVTKNTRNGVTENESTLISLRKDLEKMKNELSAKDKITDDLKYAMNLKIEKLKNSLDQTNEQLKNKTILYNATKDELESKKALFEESTKNYYFQSALVDGLNSQISVLTAEKQQTTENWTKLLIDKDNTIAKSNKNILVLQQENEELKGKNVKLVDTIGRFQSLVCTDSTEETRQLRFELAKESEKGVKQKEIYQNLINSLKSKNDTLQQELGSLRTDRTKIHGDLCDSLTRTSDLEEALKASEREIIVLKRQISALLLDKENNLEQHVNRSSYQSLTEPIIK